MTTDVFMLQSNDVQLSTWTDVLMPTKVIEALPTSPSQQSIQINVCTASVNTLHVYGDNVISWQLAEIWVRREDNK